MTELTKEAEELIEAAAKLEPLVSAVLCYDDAEREIGRFVRAVHVYQNAGRFERWRAVGARLALYTGVIPFKTELRIAFAEMLAEIEGRAE